jgi:uncharacterized repeat protein (TIGR03803 family)
MNARRTLVNQLSECKTACAILLFCVATAMTCPAQTFTTLANFNKTDGWAPYLGSLVQGTDGNLYGTTEYGGTKNSGTIFRVAPNGTLTTVYSFCSQPGCADGGGPYAGLVLGTDGDLYGTTTQSGPNGAGTIFKLTSGGVLTTLYGFCSQPNCADGDGSFGGLTLGTDGNFYGTTGAFGNNNQGTVFKITPAGKLTTLHTFTGPDGITPDGVLLQATDGNFYGTTPYGGASSACGGFFLGCGTIYKITSSGAFTVLHNFVGGVDGNRPQDGLVQGTDGNLYGTTLEGGVRESSCSYGCGIVFKISTSGTFTLLHNFDAADGSFLTSPLILATDGNYYGTTSAGGASAACSLGCGTAFTMTEAGALTSLHSFDSTDGMTPSAGLVQATNGIFYGTTSSGGTSRACDFGPCGTLFSLDVGLGKFVETVPASGKAGVKVIILGNSLTGATAVTFNGVAATFKIVSATEITTTVPAGATTGLVRVTKPAGTLSSNVSFRIK